MTIDDLVRRVPPPPASVDGDGDWTAVDRTLGRSLPADFKDLVRRYGRGEFLDFLFPHTPFGLGNLLDEADGLLELEGPLRDEFPENYPYPLHPEPGGLLVWAATVNGDRLCWLTGGEPHRWPVVVWDPRGSRYERHDVTATGFLSAWIDGRLTCGLFPPMPQVAPWFEPVRDLTRIYVRLAGDEHPYAERLRILRAALAPTTDRGGVESADGLRQDRFVATAARWRVTYETMYGHQIRIAFPPGDADRVRAALSAAVASMGCRVLSAMTGDGTPTWTR
ncbi:SMI1/KNR4 family protein [Polymorphospora lycopeni]|uniref:SMI1/KNR4 family protein n=1 Tax=Polymorphospora lycopeni TaxID=3140240 RepID=A0ABV5CM41_9ACTN